MAFHHPMILQIFLAYLVCCFNPLLAQESDNDAGKATKDKVNPYAPF